MEYSKKLIYNTILLILTSIAILSCKELSVSEEMTSLYGKEINFKGDYQCYIKSKQIPSIADINKDYKIVTYIDSAFCNSWDQVKKSVEKNYFLDFSPIITTTIFQMNY